MTNSIWSKTIGTLVGSIILYTLASIVGDICDLVDNLTSVGDIMNMFSGGKSSGPSVAEILGYICSVLVIVGYCLFFRSIIQFTEIQTTPEDQENANRIRQSYILLIIAILVDLIPVVGRFIALIFLIISYVKQLKGYKGLSQSHTWTQKAKEGASSLHSAAIWTLVAAILGIIPVVGGAIEGIIDFILFFVILNAWKRIQYEEPAVDTLAFAMYCEKLVRSYSKERLQATLAQETELDPILVQACKVELQIRNDAEELELQIRNDAEEYYETLNLKTDEELKSILNDAAVDNQPMKYCCKLIIRERRQKRQEIIDAKVEKVMVVVLIITIICLVIYGLGLLKPYF